MELYILVVADTNDGDDIERFTLVREGDVALIRKVAAAINSYDGWHNWPSSEYVDERVDDVYDGVLTTEEIDAFSEYVPRGEHGVHTIVKIQFFSVLGKEDL